MNEKLQLKLNCKEKVNTYKFVIDVDTNLKDSTIKVPFKYKHLFTDMSTITRYPCYAAQTIKVSDTHIMSYKDDKDVALYVSLDIAKQLGIDIGLDVVLLHNNL